MKTDNQIAGILRRLERLEMTLYSENELAASKTGRIRKSASVPPKIDFSLNERNFIRTYARGMSGSKKFALLLAFLVKGKVGESVGANVITARWNKMKAGNLMGYAFNTKYPTEAKTSGWVDLRKHGTYCLLNSWMEIFSSS